MKISENNKEGRIAAVCILVLSAVYISLIWNNNVWMDEAFTASLVYTDLPGVITRSMADTLPPLYNILLWFITRLLGYNIQAMKLCSVIPMILTLVLGGGPVRRRHGLRASLLFMLCVTFMPLMLYFGVEIRMYSLGFFFATGSFIYAYEAAKTSSVKDHVLFCIFSTLAGYSHHFAFVTAGFAYLYLLLHYIFFDRKRIKNWFLCLLGTFILYLPCLLVTIRQFMRVTGYFSMPDIDLHTFIQYCIYPYVVGVAAASFVCALLMAAALVLFIRDAAVKRRWDTESLYAVFCAGTFYGVLLFGALVCALMKANIFVDRYLFFSAGLLWLFVSSVMSRDARRFYAAVAAVVFIGICSYMVGYRMEYGNRADEEISFLRENMAEGDVLFCIGGHEEMENCIPFYTYLDKDAADLEFVYPLEEAVKTAGDRGTVLWIAVLDGYDISDEDGDILEKYGLKPEKAADFDFDRYKCALYKVAVTSFVKK